MGGQVQWTGQSQADDANTQTQSAPQPVFKIEKSEEQMIMTEAKTLPATPETPEIVAEEDASAVLVWGNTANTEAISSENQNTEDMPTLETTSPISTETLPTVSQEEKDEIKEMNNFTEALPTDILSEAFSNESIATSTEASQDILNQETPMQETITKKTIQDSPLFNFGWLAEDPVEEKIKETVVVNTAQNDNPGSLSDYIKNNIKQSEALIAKLDTTHTAKLEEAAEYKAEKERFSNLEEKAYEDAERMMIEKAHTERMKAYFVDQLTQANTDSISDIAIKPEVPVVEITPDFMEEKEPFYDEPPMEEDVTLIDDESLGITGSVETALTGIAVQESVKNTVEKKHKTKKTEEKKEESFSLI